MSQECDEAADVYRNAKRRARKEHVCCACRDTIRVGDLYHVVFVLFDGYTDTYKRCLRCEAIHAHLVRKCRHAAREPYRGRMWPQEDLGCGLAYEDEWGQLPDAVARLAFVTADEMQQA